MENQYIEEEGIDLLELLNVLLRNIVVIILTSIIGVGIGYTYSKYCITPLYQASSGMIVNTNQNNVGTVTSDQLNTAEQLVGTYAIIIESEQVIQQVEDNLGIEKHDVIEKVSITSVNETQVMNIAVTSADPSIAQAYANEILEVAPEILIEVVEAGSVKTVYEASLPVDPISPSIIKNAVILGLLFGMLAAMFFILRALLDNRVKSDEDLEQLLNTMVLGVIPTVESCSSKGGK